VVLRKEEECRRRRCVPVRERQEENTLKFIWRNARHTVDHGHSGTKKLRLFFFGEQSLLQERLFAFTMMRFVKRQTGEKQ